MKKWLPHLIGLTIVVAATAAIVLAVAGGGPGAAASNPGAPLAQYEVTVRFNTSVTQDDIDEVEALVRSYDDDLEFFVQESFPPTGRAFLEAYAAARCPGAPNFCVTVKEDLEARSYVDRVSCELWQESDEEGSDATIAHRNEGASDTDGPQPPTVAAGAPAAPKDLEAFVVHDQLQITLFWQDNADNEESLVVERSTGGCSKPWTVVATLRANSSQYDDTGLENGATYWYRVAAANAAGTSGYSNIVWGTATALPTPPPGDASCDGSVDSIDAALVMQLDAGLLSSLQCMEFADVNEDGIVNAIDAAVILQFVAGLDPSPPSR